MENLKALTESVCRIAREAGYFLKEERKNFSREVVQEKHAHDYVSYVDKASEKELCLPFGNCFPKPDSLPRKGLPPIVTNPIAG